MMPCAAAPEQYVICAVQYDPSGPRGLFLRYCMHGNIHRDEDTCNIHHEHYRNTVGL